MTYLQVGYIISDVLENVLKMVRVKVIGVWLSLARAPALGAGGRRFESCHPDEYICGCSSMVEHQPSKLDTWVRFPSPAFLDQVFIEL